MMIIDGATDEHRIAIGKMITTSVRSTRGHLSTVTGTRVRVRPMVLLTKVGTPASRPVRVAAQHPRPLPRHGACRP
ncbi:MAG TPA: hypothetical protein PL117_05050 [Accumulibacter sp.]|uniref:hypothetical protein n=1 Tax=Accumulibacter sp. TaxID=2053492 RepID=UPI002BB2AE9A|nr:hypothetical protein [Accumulibacter sp.]HRF72122.1 hypothetical protein [Accumulibacter sp.]